jgi:hypothetical protein
LVAAATLLLHVVASGIRRIWFNPLSRFPGPKFAALTLWNEFYWDVVKRGKFMWKIEEMHAKYGIRAPANLISILTGRQDL